MDSSHWDDRYRAADRLWSVGPNLFVADRLNTANPGTGLDLASGEGRNAVWLSENGWQMTAVDFSEVAVERGRALGSSVDFHVGDVVDWEPKAQFDLILIAYLHVPRPEFQSLLVRVTQWLEPGGELFLIGHDRSNLERGYGGPQVPEILWDVDEILESINGFRVVEASVVRRPVETDEGTVFARDTLVRVQAGD